MDLFSGENCISVKIIFDILLIDSVWKYRDYNILLFGAKYNKPVAPIDVKKLVLILVSSKILGHCL